MVLVYCDINSTSFIFSQPYALHSLLTIIYPIDPGSSGTAISVAAEAAVRRFRGPGSVPGPHHWPPGEMGRVGAAWGGLGWFESPGSPEQGSSCLVAGICRHAWAGDIII